MTWKECFIGLNGEYLRIWQNDPEDFFRQMANLESVVGCVAEVYSILLREGDLVAIENIEETMKRQFFEEAKRLSENKDKKHIVRVCKALYTFSVITNQ